MGWSMFCTRNILCLLFVLVLSGCSSVPKQQHSAVAEAEYQTAIAAMQAGQSDAAVGHFLKMTQDYPTLAGPYANLGLLYQRQGLLKEAEAAFDQAIALQPMSAKIFNSAAVFYRSQGRFKDAESAYLHAIEKSSSYVDPVLNLAILYDLYLKQPAKAIVYYQRYLALSDKNNGQVALWLADLEQRQP